MIVVEHISLKNICIDTFSHQNKSPSFKNTTTFLLWFILQNFYISKHALDYITKSINERIGFIWVTSICKISFNYKNGFQVYKIKYRKFRFVSSVKIIENNASGQHLLEPNRVYLNMSTFICVMSFQHTTKWACNYLSIFWNILILK